VITMIAWPFHKIGYVKDLFLFSHEIALLQLAGNNHL